MKSQIKTLQNSLQVADSKTKEVVKEVIFFYFLFIYFYQKIVYQDKIVEKPVDRIVYQDRIVEKSSGIQSDVI